MTEQTTPEKTAERRFSVIVNKDVQENIAKLAKEHKISQSDVIMTLYENSDLVALKSKFEAKREVKVNSRGSKSAVLAKIGKLTPEQLEKLLASLE